MPFTALTRDRFTVIWVATRSLPSHVCMGWEAFLIITTENRQVGLLLFPALLFISCLCPCGIHRGQQYKSCTERGNVC